MAYLNADEVLVWVGNGAGSEVFYAPAGQTGVEWTRSAARVDRTVKTSAYEVGRPGVMAISNFGLDLKPSLPDANGYTRLETVHKTKAAVNIQVRRGGATATADDAIFAAAMHVETMPTSAPQGADVSCRISFFLAEDPTIDVLS